MYIGNNLQVANPSYKIIDDISSGFNGSTTSFALQVSGATPVPFPINTQQVMISVNGVIQEPDPSGSAGFKLLGSNIVFSSAPANGHAFFGTILAGADYVTAGSEFPDGSVTAPSFTFEADQDSGFFRIGSGDVGYSSNGVQVLNYSGNGLIIASGKGLTVDTNTLHVDATNNAVGIGTTTPLTPDGSNADNPNNGIALSIYGDSPAINLVHNTAGGSAAADDYAAINFGRTGSSTNPYRSIIAYKQDTDTLHINAQNAVRFDIGGSINATEAMRIDSNGRLLLGTTATTGASFGSTPLAIFESSTTNNYGRLGLIYNGDDQHASAITFGKSRGTSDGSNTVVQADDQIGSLFFHGADGTDKQNRAAAIMAFVDGTPGSNDMPGRLTFLTTADGAGSPTERMRIDSSGRVLLGTTTEGAAASDDLTIATSGSTGITIRSGTSDTGNIYFSDATSGTGEYAGYLEYSHNSNALVIGTNTSASLTLDSTQSATFSGIVHVNNGLIKVQGAEGNSAILEIFSDQGDDNEDKWRLLKSSGNHDLVIQNYGSGSWATNVTFDQNEGATFGGTVSDSAGELRSIPIQTETSAHTPNASSAGYVIYTTHGVTINNSVFSAGDALTIVNNSGSDITITQGSGLTLYNTADAATGNRTLAGRGMATMWFASASVAYISGAGLS